ncbi:BQ2448_885 [Microbotryum intermedium]|uniref:BQ2448_885 protein n=1 Tax=Microbotryum intermedium TaxID=269621 RepID=A0A238FA63_9BASI|nr:BQ2448_885 [Microbotryum intermedium]
MDQRSSSATANATAAASSAETTASGSDPACYPEAPQVFHYHPARLPQSDSAAEPTRPLPAHMHPSAMNPMDRDADSDLTNSSSTYPTGHLSSSANEQGQGQGQPPDVGVPRRRDSSAAAKLIPFCQHDGNHAHQDDPHASITASAWDDRYSCSSSATTQPRKLERTISCPTIEKREAKDVSTADPLSTGQRGWFLTTSRSDDTSGSEPRPDVNKSNTYTSKRPPNAWICYRTDRSKEMRAQGATPLPQAAISKLIASEWRAESVEVRQKYVKLAQEKAKAVLLAYPDYAYQPARKFKDLGTIARSGRRVSSSNCKERRSTAIQVPTPEVQGQPPSEATMVPMPERGLAPAQSTQPNTRWLMEEYNGLGGSRRSAAFEDDRGFGVSSQPSYSQWQYTGPPAEATPEDEKTYDYSPMYQVSENHHQRTWYVPASASHANLWEPPSGVATTSTRFFRTDPCQRPVPQANMTTSVSFARPPMYLPIHDHRSASYDPVPLSPTTLLAPQMMYAAGPAYNYHFWPDLNTQT